MFQQSSQIQGTGKSEIAGDRGIHKYSFPKMGPRIRKKEETLLLWFKPVLGCLRSWKTLK